MSIQLYLYDIELASFCLSFSSHTDLSVIISELVGVMIKSGTTATSFVECPDL